MHHLFLRALLLFILFIPVLNAEQAIRVENAWIREAPPTIRTHAGYLTIINNKSENIQLINITSEYFERIEIHQSMMGDGIAKMIELGTIKIPAQSEFIFSPGDYHLMLLNNKNQLNQGDKIPLQLIFADGTIFPITLEVKHIDLSDQHDHHH
jgi:copper(I)-binding protein